MARQARLVIPNQVHFVKQVGHNFQEICKTNEDAKRLRTIIAETLPLFEVALHGFLISTSEFYLLLSPQNETAISGFVQAISRKYVPYFNQKHARSGSLWNGRFLCTIVEVAHYGLDVVLYMNEKANSTAEQFHLDVANLSASPHYLGYSEIRWLHPIKEWWLLGNTPFDREKAYSEILQQGLGVSKTKALQSALGHDKVLGSEPFIDALQRSTSQKLKRGKAGRPVRALPTAPNIVS